MVMNELTQAVAWDIDRSDDLYEQVWHLGDFLKLRLDEPLQIRSWLPILRGYRGEAIQITRMVDEAAVRKRCSNGRPQQTWLLQTLRARLRDRADARAGLSPRPKS